MIEFRQKVHH